MRAARALAARKVCMTAAAAEAPAQCVVLSEGHLSAILAAGGSDMAWSAVAPAPFGWRPPLPALTAPAALPAVLLLLLGCALAESRGTSKQQRDLNYLLVGAAARRVLGIVFG
eukprot:355682-Chlamydomonas_euryale.AAC.4